MIIEKDLLESVICKLGDFQKCVSEFRKDDFMRDSKCGESIMYFTLITNTIELFSYQRFNKYSLFKGHPSQNSVTSIFI